MFCIVSISDSDKHFASSIEEYQKRLGKQLIIENIKPFKDSNHELVIQKETEKLIEHINKKYADREKVLLIKEGKPLSTLDLAKNSHGKKTVYLIWGPYGVQEKLIDSAFPQMKKISFGAITMPHGLAKLVLVEQLYRVTTLHANKKYHY